MWYFSYDTPLGVLSIYEEQGVIVRIDFGNCNHDTSFKETDLIKECHEQLTQYFSGKRKKFSVPLSPQGTEFQKKIWNILLTIPYGSTKSYKEVAIKSGNSKSARAVGNANNKNPIPIIIPCHRVIRGNGMVGGYASGQNIKEFLLNLEKNNTK